MKDDISQGLDSLVRNTGLFDITYRPSSSIGRMESFGRGRMGSLLKEMYDPKAEFTFYQSVVNPEAITALPDYVVTRADNDHWKVRQKKEGEVPDDEVGSINTVRELRFGSTLRRDYLDVLTKLAHGRFGKANYGTYPLVDGMESMDAPREALSWPFVHVVKKDGFTFPRLLDQLHGDEAYALLREAQAPHHYNTPHIDQLRHLHIQPLLLGKETWKVTGRDLKPAIDFLLQFRYSNELRSDRFDED